MKLWLESFFEMIFKEGIDQIMINETNDCKTNGKNK